MTNNAASAAAKIAGELGELDVGCVVFLGLGEFFFP